MDVLDNVLKLCGEIEDGVYVKVLELVGSLSSPGHGIVELCTLLKPVREEGKIKFQGSEPGPRDWESSTLRTRLLPWTKVYLSYMYMYVLPVIC